MVANGLVGWVFGAAILALPSWGWAQTQAQFDRIGQLARFHTAASGICLTLGARVEPVEIIRAAIMTEVATMGLQHDVAERVVSEAVDRETGKARIENKTDLEQLKSSGAFRNFWQTVARRGGACAAAATDATFSQVISLPTDFDLNAASVKVADELLAPSGWASWQTPRIQAKGDILIIAGACRRQFGAARSDKLVATYGKAEDPRERRYYMASFDLGINDYEPDELNLAQCERALKSFLATLASGKAR